MEGWLDRCYQMYLVIAQSKQKFLVADLDQAQGLLWHQVPHLNNRDDRLAGAGIEEREFFLDQGIDNQKDAKDDQKPPEKPQGGRQRKGRFRAGYGSLHRKADKDWDEEQA